MAATLSEVSLRRRADYRRTAARRLAEIDASLSVLRDRLSDGAPEDRRRKLFLALRDRRRDLDAALEDLMRAPDDEWCWQKRELEDARARLADLVEAALGERVVQA